MSEKEQTGVDDRVKVSGWMRARADVGDSMLWIFFVQAEDGIRDLVRSRGRGDVYKRQVVPIPVGWLPPADLRLGTNPEIRRSNLPLPFGRDPDRLASPPSRILDLFAFAHRKDSTEIVHIILNLSLIHI